MGCALHDKKEVNFVYQTPAALKRYYVKLVIGGLTLVMLGISYAQLAIYMASVIMGDLALKNGFYTHTHD